MLEVRSCNDHFGKAIPKIEELMILPKAYLPEIRARAQRQARKGIRDPMQPGLQLHAVDGLAPYELVIRVKQGYSVMAATKCIVESQIEVNGNLSEGIQLVRVSSLGGRPKLPLQKPGFRVGLSRILPLAN